MSHEYLDGFLLISREKDKGPLALRQPREGKMIADIEIQIILETLKSNQGNKSKTARALGIGRTTLYCKLRSISQMNHGDLL